MARFRTSVDSPLPPEEAFARMAAFERVPEWDPNTTASRRVGDAQGLGSAFDVTTKFGRSTLDVRYTTSAFDPPRRLVLEATLPNGNGLRDEITVEAREGGSRVTYDARILPRGIWRLADPIFHLIFSRVGARAIGPLTTYLSGR